MDRVTSRLASAIVDVEAFRRVWDRIKPIIRDKSITVPNTIRRLDHSRTYTLDNIVAISLLRREVATKKRKPKTNPRLTAWVKNKTCCAVYAYRRLISLLLLTKQRKDFLLTCLMKLSNLVFGKQEYHLCIRAEGYSTAPF